ncbi:MAG TPA: helix-turn-helix domain-containing protein [Pirellulales bacterium]|jgi:addiction module HigA family antidote|nr:helix-turn-helix domain-containing protein [Pirellulales bacterium]
MASAKHTYHPDYATPPGATLKEAIEARGLSQADFAARMGMAEKTVSQIVNGIAPISVDTAYKLELVLGIPASFWNRMELAYREHLIRSEETSKLEVDIAWLKEIPVKELIERKYIVAATDKSHLVRQLLEFFGVSSVQAWRDVLAKSAIQFRGGEAHQKYPGYVAAWRRLGVLSAQAMETAPFNPQEFLRALRTVRGMTTKNAKEWSVEIKSVCAAAGVAVALTEEIPKASISGAARWLTKDKAMIQVSLKYKTDDQFWFTFFHEAGHILKHGKKQVFVDYGYSEDQEEEREANEFARDFLIPPSYAHRLPFVAKSRPLIKDFAATIGISPGIVVGRLQHDGLVYPGAYTDLKRKYEWA